MPLIQERQNKVGNFLKFEADRQEALARTTGVVTYTTAGTADMEVGQVLEKSGTKWIELTNADPSAKELAILLDDRIEEMRIADQALATPTNDTPSDTALLVGGFSPCIVRQGGLAFGAANSANIALAVTKLEAQAIRVDTLFSGKLQA